MDKENQGHKNICAPIKSEGFLEKLILMKAFVSSALFALPWIGKVDSIWAQSWVPGLIYGKTKRAPVAPSVDDLTLGFTLAYPRKSGFTHGLKMKEMLEIIA